MKQEKDNCPCPANCNRHADCDACIAHHKANGGLPFCKRDKTTKNTI